VVCGADGVAVFDALHRRGRVSDAILQAFDLLEFDGVDYRPLPFSRRKDRLARLLARVPAGIALNEHTDARGELVFQQACAMGLEGIVSKRLTAPYKSGPSRDWIKVKNPDSPAMVRKSGGSPTAFNMTISASFKKKRSRFFSERIHAPADSFISKNEGMNEGAACLIPCAA
jgi:hypothetical protein